MATAEQRLTCLKAGFAEELTDELPKDKYSDQSTLEVCKTVLGSRCGSRLAIVPIQEESFVAVLSVGGGDLRMSCDAGSIAALNSALFGSADCLQNEKSKQPTAMELDIAADLVNELVSALRQKASNSGSIPRTSSLFELRCTHTGASGRIQIERPTCDSQADNPSAQRVIDSSLIGRIPFEVRLSATPFRSPAAFVRSLMRGSVLSSGLPLAAPLSVTMDTGVIGLAQPCMRNGKKAASLLKVIEEGDVR